MPTNENLSPPLLKPPAHADVLALGFGTTVAMWGIGYFCRLQPAVVPAWLLVVLLVGCQFAGGFLAGRHSGRGWRGGLAVGLLSSLLNILILGSLLSGDDPNRVVPSAVWWLPGALLAGAIVGALGGAAGARSTERAATPGVWWFGGFTAVAAAATFFLVIIGGAVTSKGAGLAVVDWPNSFGYNMFLYPLSKMGGGIYFEHAHRLFGSLVGLTTLVLVTHLFIYDHRPWMKGFGSFALVVVVIQGILGGLRVTGRFTLSTSPDEVAPNLLLAVVHGVLGQVFFATMVALAVFTSGRWVRNEPPAVRPSIATDRGFTVTLVVLLIVQLVLGAVQRHLMQGLLIHITLAVVVAGVGLACGVRAWGLYRDLPVLPRLGKLLLWAICVQILLGLGAAAMVGMYPRTGNPPTLQVLITTAHQAVGAFLLADAVLLALWSRRIATPGAAESRNSSAITGTEIAENGEPVPGAVETKVARPPAQ